MRDTHEPAGTGVGETLATLGGQYGRIYSARPDCTHGGAVVVVRVVVTTGVRTSSVGVSRSSVVVGVRTPPTRVDEERDERDDDDKVTTGTTGSGVYRPSLMDDELVAPARGVRMTLSLKEGVSGVQVSLDLDGQDSTRLARHTGRSVV